MTMVMSDACTIMFSRSINDTSRNVRMMIVSDTTTWNVILTTVESSFTIVLFITLAPGANVMKLFMPVIY